MKKKWKIAASGLLAADDVEHIVCGPRIIAAAARQHKCMKIVLQSASALQQVFNKNGRFVFRQLGQMHSNVVVER